MKSYFYDTEFFERMVTPWFGRARHQIDLISIGMVSDDGREYYAICNEFDVNGAWRNEWLRTNVLHNIWQELLAKRGLYEKTYHFDLSEPFSMESLRYLLKHYAKSMEEIAHGIREFAWPSTYTRYTPDGPPFDLYGYYSSYDHVVLSSLFGAMINLPKGFPMYTRDLKQMVDARVEESLRRQGRPMSQFDEVLKSLKTWKEYPITTNEHNALADARWNKKLFEFLKKL